MRAQIQISNEQAAINPNLYPIQEQATQLELWEYVPCSCEETCTCKKLGCTHHWKLKKNVRFDDFVNGFLRTFVNSNFHQSILDALAGKEPVKINTRATGALRVLKNIRKDWEIISSRAASHNKTLFCDDWVDDFWKQYWAFPLSNSIYEAKQYCILLPDICVPYDDNSRRKLKKFYSVQDIDYLNFLVLMRDSFARSMKEHDVSLPMLRKFDDPRKSVPFDANRISLPRKNNNYGTDYRPEERQISIVLDKCFYQPTRTSQEPQQKNNNVSPVTVEHLNADYRIYPLSGNGEIITVTLENNTRHVTWGKLKFRVSDQMIKTILTRFFIDSNKWYLLGASMTAPDYEGLGFFVQQNFSSFTPRHASAIAAIMVQEKMLLSRGRKPIYLTRSSMGSL